MYIKTWPRNPGDLPRDFRAQAWRHIHMRHQRPLGTGELGDARMHTRMHACMHHCCVSAGDDVFSMEGVNHTAISFSREQYKDNRWDRYYCPKAITALANVLGTHTDTKRQNKSRFQL